MARGVFLKKNGERYYPAPYMPIGSIYLTVSNDNPSRWFGGTWEKLSGGYIYCAAFTIQKTTYTGWGAQSHTLTVNQIPSHTHDIYDDINGNGSRQDVPFSSFYASIGGQTIYRPQWDGITDQTNRRLRNTNTGGGQGHTHNIATIDVFMWKRIA